MTVMTHVKPLLPLLRMASGTLTTLHHAYTSEKRGGAEFERTVVPLIESHVSLRNRPDVRTSLWGAGIRFHYLGSCYGHMVGATFPDDLLVLCGAFSRAYDDLFDVRGPVPGDVLDIVSGVSETDGRDEFQTLLIALYGALTERFDADHRLRVAAALERLHVCQLASLGQRDRELPRERLAGICADKGRAAAEAFFIALARDAPPHPETADLVGPLFQAIDDLADAQTDRLAGVRTPATEGLAPVETVVDDAVRVGRLLRTRYGRRARPFTALIALHVMAAATGPTVPVGPAAPGEGRRPPRLALARRQVELVARTAADDATHAAPSGTPVPETVGRSSPS